MASTFYFRMTKGGVSSAQSPNTCSVASGTGEVFMRSYRQKYKTLTKGTDLAGPEENAAAIKVWEYLKLAWWWGTVGFCEWTTFAWFTTLFQFIVGLVLAYELIVRMRRLDNQENDDDLIFSVPLTEPFPVEVDDEADNVDFAARLSVPPPAELGDKQRELSSTDVSAPKDGGGQTPDPNLCSTTRSPSLRMPVDRLGRPRRVHYLISALTAYSIVVIGITAVDLDVISKSPEALAPAFYHHNLATGWLNIRAVADEGRTQFRLDSTTSISRRGGPATHWPCHGLVTATCAEQATARPMNKRRLCDPRTMALRASPAQLGSYLDHKADEDPPT
ncbi:hypothetical protein FA10DRAFT_291777 [Acaromyces ingoldii]|uniref:Uncharacterized protein n=1 Tax=Acaromyces ingoldii TaxID=215250 RepID=A0A316YAQ4_9BASI|nr:hypothetical protein FA10DRAFT_291777 [Acaromyces ingoldii]PWN86697.1 hypothetical protein FA10DRAFT_291777 [Acaromyces ingoldii]